MSEPVLWHLKPSHYNEKARWALDYKRIPHRRVNPPPGAHMLIALALTRRVATLPVLQLGGHAIGDSTRIIAALEERWPEPALYPADPEQRRRALELEEFFDEELGADIRRALYHVLLEHPDLVLTLFEHGQTAVARGMVRATFPLLRIGMRKSLRIYAEQAAESQAKSIAAIDRLESELGDGDYLVGDSFTVADLTAASLLYPLALPPEYPYPTLPREVLPGEARELLDSLKDRPGVLWVGEMYRRHRLS